MPPLGVTPEKHVRLVALFDDLASRFRALPPEPLFHITYNETDPRKLAEHFGREAAETIRQGTAAAVYEMTSTAAHFAARALEGTADGDPGWEAERYGRQVQRVITNYAATPEHVYHYARDAAHAANMVIRGWCEVGPVLSLPPTTPLCRAFRVLAAVAARTATLVPPTTSDDEAIRAWCVELRRRHYFGPWAPLRDPADASARCCAELSAELFARLTDGGASSFGQQLRQAMQETRVSVDWLVAETSKAQTPVSKRTIERLRADRRNPQIGTVRALEAALTKARNGVPMQFLLPTTSRQRRKPRSPRTRLQKAAKRR